MKQLIKEILVESARLAELTQPVDYEVYVELTERRQSLAEEVQRRSEISEAEKALLRSISQYDEVILGQMEVLMKEAASGIQKINGSKKQKESYGNVSAHESIMFDRGV